MSNSLQELQQVVATASLEDAGTHLVYALKEDMSAVRGALQIIMSPQSSVEQRQQTYTIASNRIDQFFQTVNEVLIKVLLQRLRDECS